MRMAYTHLKASPSSRGTKLKAGLATLLAAALGAYVLPGLLASGGSAKPNHGGPSSKQTWPWPSSATDIEAPTLAPTPSTPLAQVRAKVLEQGVLKGTQVAGSWSLGPNGKPTPSMDLRERFEYYLLGLGDASPAELRALIADEAEAQLGKAGAQAVMAIFDRYWALRMHAPRYRLVPDDRSTWSAAFEEQKALRRQYLGADWAHAFFHEEEALFEQTMNGTATAAAPTAPVDEAATQRLAQLDAQWASWERRLDQAKALKHALASNISLSEPQRRQQFEKHLRSNFEQAEYARALGLIGWP